jgi:outer membrane murein-binding lipoprotein Lpp
MTERTDDWRNIFTDLTDDSGCYEIDKVNIYKLTSHLEELYLKIRELESDVELLKSYAWEQ